MSALKTLAIAAVGLAAMTAVPASAVVTTFATFSAPTPARNFRLVNSGNSSGVGRVTDAVLYSTTTAGATSPGAALVRFSFLQPQFAPFVTNVNASFTFNATIARNTPVTGTYNQPITSGSFSFLSTAPITVTGPDFIIHTYATGSNLLSGTFTNGVLSGIGSSAGLNGSTAGTSVITFTSDFLDFTNTVQRDVGFTLTSINPVLSKHGGLNGALSSFRATAGGQFSSDPAPLINGLTVVPEPNMWLLMIGGFGLVGASARRRRVAA